ncbi:alpha/beta-hydrolase [Stipitochalara longipes BDJ]|nr:alpha/beta-hydrolase [Stipitochalara longipes BDJ]
MMESNIPRPPYDAELNKVLTSLNFPPIIAPEHIPAVRARPTPGPDEFLLGLPITHEDLLIKGPGGDIPISIFRSNTSISTPHPAILWFHGGGFFSGSRFGGIPNLLKFVEELNAIIVTVEYRLGPEHPDPAPVEDGYACLVWIGEKLVELGINPTKLMIAGSSAGAGLAAGVALYARDHGGPAICAQLLQSPMLDDRLETLANQQYTGDGTFTRGSAETGWNALLGNRRGGKDVSIYAAPGRATELSGLPPAFIDGGDAEIFRDDIVAFASKFWAAGVQAELHIWGGAFHRFQAFAPKAAVSVIADTTRDAWVRRILAA